MLLCNCLTLQQGLLAELPPAALSIWLLVTATGFYQPQSALFYTFRDWSFEKNLSQAQSS